MKRKQGNRCSTGHYYRYKYGNKKECHMIITGKNMGYNFSVGKRKSPREAWKKDWTISGIVPYIYQIGDVYVSWQHP
jgi:hypothetical protein